MMKILVGPPASGKSTFTKAFLKDNPRWVSVSRDDFRYMMRNEGWCKPDVEQLITKLVDSTITTTINANKPVIYDATNCNRKYLLEFIEKFKYISDIEFEPLEVELEELYRRDSLRERKVGKEVIDRMWDSFQELKKNFSFEPIKKVEKLYKNPVFDPELPNAILVDLDGTLFHIQGRRSPFSTKGVEHDDLDNIVARQIDIHHDYGDNIIFMSGREEAAREGTVKALERHRIPYEGLFMRSNGDSRKDSIIKRELYETHIRGKYNVMCVYDDRDQVVQLWRSLGLKCFQVEYGNF